MEIMSSTEDGFVVQTDFWKNVPTWCHSNIFYKADLTKDSPMVMTTPPRANLISSKAYEVDGISYHTPIFDLDIDARLVPSSTPGHWHLYLNRVITDTEYGNILKAFNEAGIVQNGIIKEQWEKYGQTTVRLPGIQKKVGDKGSDAGPQQTFPMKLEAVSYDLTPAKFQVDPPTAKDPEDFLESVLEEAEKEEKYKVALNQLKSLEQKKAQEKEANMSPENYEPTPAQMEYAFLVHVAAQTGNTVESVIHGWAKYKELNPEKEPIKESTKPPGPPPDTNPF